MLSSTLCELLWWKLFHDLWIALVDAFPWSMKALWVEIFLFVSELFGK